MAAPARWTLLSSLLVTITMLLGCSGPAGTDGTDGTDAHDSLLQMTTEPPGPNCPYGGTRLQTGLDTDRSGVLDSSEVAATQYVCNGAPGQDGHDSLLATSPEGPGANCVAGGTRIQSGVDLDDDGTLDAAEVTSTQYVCAGVDGTDGTTSLVAVSTEPPGAACPAGGVRVQSGLDADGDQTLDASEVALTRFVCNGTDGADGLTSLVTTSAEPAGPNCAFGGTRIESGLDADRDAILDVAEVTAIQFACNGAPGADGLTALVATSTEPPGAACAAGGTKIDFGLDADRSGTLDPGEVAATRYACNGTDGADGLTSLVEVTVEPAGPNCAAGGSLIRSGLDADGDGSLDLAEAALAAYVCDGAPGSDGTDGLASLVALAPEPAGPSCAVGGTRIQSGLDADADGFLDAGEVAMTQYVCDGADGTNGQASLIVTSVEPPGASCPNGGTRIVAGLDANGNGTLDPAEEGAPRFACNGAAGADGYDALVATSPYSGPSCAYGGIQIDTGLDADRSGTLEADEIALTQHVCNGDTGGPGATSLVATSSAPAGGVCQFGGARIDAGLDTDGDGTLDAGEVTSTAWACDGAAGAGLETLLALTPEPAGPNCAFGGTRVDSGIDGNGNGVLDPPEVSATQYVCDPDSTHPTVVGVTPAPGSLLLPYEDPFCVTFSEAIDPSTLDEASVKLDVFDLALETSLTYDPATFTACLHPVQPLALSAAYTLSVGDLGTQIRDLAGNQLVSPFFAQYVTESSPRPNLRVTIDSQIAAGAGTVEVSYTVRNVGAADAGPFMLGFYVDPPVPPEVGMAPDALVDLASGLAPGASLSGTVQLTASASAVIAAYADAFGVVAESDEKDNIGLLAPALTGAIQVSATTVEAYTQITVTAPVNASARTVQLSLGGGFTSGYEWLGSMSGNEAGEGYISGIFTVPAFPDAAPVPISADVTDAWGIETTLYRFLSSVSTTNLAVSFGGGGTTLPPLPPPLPPTQTTWIDSGIPLTFLTITPSIRPNLVVAVDSLTEVAPGLVEVAYTVSNTGFGEATSFTLGLFVDPISVPPTGSVPDVSVDLGPLPAGESISGVLAVTAWTNPNVVAFVDPAGSVDETDENDNLATLLPAMTASPIAAPSTVEVGGQVTVTVPVNGSTRSVEVFLASDSASGPSFWAGSAWGNDAGEGTIDVTFTVPPEIDPANIWAVWVTVHDALQIHSVQYGSSKPTSIEYERMDLAAGGTFVPTGIPITFLDVTAPTKPNLVVTIDAVTDLSGGGIEVAYTVANNGFGDAGTFAVGFFVDPALPPGVGTTPIEVVDLPTGLPQGSAYSGVITLPGGPASIPVAYADVGGTVDEVDESDNAGRLPAAITGPISVTPASVEQASSIEITAPVSRTARRLEVRIKDSTGVAWWIGSSWGNDAGQGVLIGTFALPPNMAPGDYTLSFHVWDDYGSTGRGYFEDPTVSTTNYAVRDIAPPSSTVSDSGIPQVSISVVAGTHANLTMTIDAVTDNGTGLVDVAYTVNNAGFADATAFTVGFFVDPVGEPAVGSLADATVDVAALPVGTSVVGTIQLPATQTSLLLGFADVLGAVLETNESDNLAIPPPALLGPIVATPTTVDEGTLLTLRMPVNGSTGAAEVMLGDASPVGEVSLGYVYRNDDEEGFLEGSVLVPLGSASLAPLSIGVVLHDVDWARSTPYLSIPSISTTTLVTPSDTVTPSDPFGGWVDSGIPITFVTVIPPTRPNLVVTIDSIVDVGDGTVNVDYTVRNTGAGDATAFDVGFFVDPAAIPAVGSSTSGLIAGLSLPVDGSYTDTINLPGSATSAIFAYADVTNLIDEQSETDNLHWKIPVPAMTASPVPPASTVPVGGTVSLTIPVSVSVRSVEIYIGLMMTSSSEPSYLIGTGSGNTAGEGFITVTCSPPPGSQGDWYVWVATYDAYRLEWRGYVPFGPLSTTSYTEYDPNLSGPPSVSTSMALATLTVTPTP